MFAGLVNLMDELGPNNKDYFYFLKLYKKMANKFIFLATAFDHF